MTDSAETGPGQDVELARGVAAGDALSRTIVQLWQQTRIDWSFATDQLAAEFRRQRRLGARERRFVAETLYGMIRHARRVDDALRDGGLVATAAAPDRARLLVYLVLEQGLPPAEAAVVRPDVDWQAVASIDVRLAAMRDPVERIARRCSLPDWLARRLVDDHGAAAAEQLAAALQARAPMTVRVNTLATDRERLAAELIAGGLTVEPGRLSDTALHVVSRTNLFGLDAFRGGRFEAQDEGSQLVAEIVAPPPRSLVVDACAGAGGKTLALAALMANRGRILALDVDRRKLSELRRRARRAGVTTVQAVEVLADPRAAWPPPVARIEGTADRVLVDAPCTGTGALRRNPEARWRLQPGDVDALAARQLGIVDRALSLVAPGGRLIYATCSVLAAENRGVVDVVLARNPQLELVPIKEIWGRERAAAISYASETFLEVAPHRQGTDGFFAAVLRRRR